jgi:signal peptidase I
LSCGVANQDRRLKTKRTRPEFSIIKGSELSLSGRALVDLLDAVLQKGMDARFQAKGFSMAPFIKNNDVVTISPLQGERAGLGDIIAFAHPETQGLCIHRIVRKKGDLYVTKGDNRSETEESVPIENILGSVTRVQRDGKQVFLGLGPERCLIGFLGRRGLLFPLLLPLWNIVRPFMRRSAR